MFFNEINPLHYFIYKEITKDDNDDFNVDRDDFDDGDDLNDDEDDW